MEQRITRRFQLHLPLTITRSGVERVTVIGCTENISSSGVLFTSQREPDLGGSIEYLITLNHNGPQSINLRCLGKVLRVDRMGEEGQQDIKFQIAASLNRYEFVRESARPAKQIA